jgi:hypothetical protein
MTQLATATTQPMERLNHIFAIAADRHHYLAQLIQLHKLANVLIKQTQLQRNGNGTANARERATVSSETSY